MMDKNLANAAISGALSLAAAALLALVEELDYNFAFGFFFALFLFYALDCIYYFVSYLKSRWVIKRRTSEDQPTPAPEVQS